MINFSAETLQARRQWDCIFKILNKRWMWLFLPVIPAFRGLKQEDCEFETSLGYITSSKLSWSAQWVPEKPGLHLKLKKKPPNKNTISGKVAHQKWRWNKDFPRQAKAKWICHHYACLISNAKGSFSSRITYKHVNV
jgi:hypothetical protein